MLGHKEEKDPYATGVVDNEAANHEVGEVIDGEVIDPVYNAVKRGLKPRHTQLIAIGGTIGTGLFVGAGATLAKYGPAFLFTGYVIISILVWLVVTALAEMGAYLPVHGGTMSFYGTRYVSKSLGFAMGWLYWYSYGILIPFELTATGLVIDYWPNSVNIAVWITIILIFITLLNFMPVKVYGEAEFWFAGIKVVLIVGLLIMSFIFFWGGAANQHGILGFHYWKHPGSINPWLIEGSGGICASFWGSIVAAVFPFTFAPEMLIVTGGEMKNPRRNLPRAANKFFWRILVFYVGGVFAIGIICPSNVPDLVSGSSGAKSSPFVIAIVNAGIHGLPSVVNAAILTSALSAGNAFLYLSSRSLYSLAIAGSAPAIFKKCTKRGTPWVSVLVSALFGPLAYMNVSNSGSTVFNWFVNLTNTSGFISWMCCCIIYIRFRKAYLLQGREADIPYHHWVQPWGAWVGVVAFAGLCLINGFNVFFPGQWSVSSFFTDYVGIPIFLVLYVGARIWYWKKETWAYPPEEVDLTTGLAEVLSADVEIPPPDTVLKKIKAWIE